MKLLIIEDEYLLRQQLCDSFSKRGYLIDEAADGELGIYLGLENNYDLAIIDVGLPKISGLEVIKKFRQQHRTFPILILTAQGRWEEKVNGFELGADDYLVKPFYMEELVARVSALIRRSVGKSHPLVRLDDIELNTVRQEVLVKGKVIVLTSFEYKIFEYLMLHIDRVITKAELVEHVYDQDFDRDSNVIEVFIGRLRKKLDPSQENNPIETIRGRGYRVNSGSK